MQEDEPGINKAIREVALDTFMSVNAGDVEESDFMSAAEIVGAYKLGYSSTKVGIAMGEVLGLRSKRNHGYNLGDIARAWQTIGSDEVKQLT